MAKIQIALATDMNYLRPTLVAMGSAIDNSSRPVTVHLLADNLTDKAKEAVEVFCKEVSKAKLVWHDVSDLLPRDAPTYFPRTCLARLLLPEMLNGRVLYIDSDTITLADIGLLFDFNLQDNPIGAVRDFWQIDGILNGYTDPNRVCSVQELMSPFPVYDYFNSGVILMDCERIKTDSELHKNIRNTEYASKMQFPDQDFLNRTFKGRVKFLDPSWNSFYGRQRKTHRIARNVLPPHLVHKRQNPRILHFLSYPKPWHPIGAKKFLQKPSLLGVSLVVGDYRSKTNRYMRRVGKFLKPNNNVLN